MYSCIKFLARIPQGRVLGVGICFFLASLKLKRIAATLIFKIFKRLSSTILVMGKRVHMRKSVRDLALVSISREIMILLELRTPSIYRDSSKDTSEVLFLQALNDSRNEANAIHLNFSKALEREKEQYLIDSR